ncbi:ribonuclease H [Senna tora]|uniref:Ribonuclease H n=1 Tax=Senna tora TaxID=362788 RepID=A0A834WAK4_9FABA|nr:ribonuclease H [Senna tora]
MEEALDLQSNRQKHTMLVPRDICQKHGRKELELERFKNGGGIGSTVESPKTYNAGTKGYLPEAWAKRTCSRPFRFEKMWMNHEDCAELVKNSWKGGSIGDDPAQKLNFLAENLKVWNKSTFGHVGKKIKNLQQQISDFYNSSGPSADVNHLRSLQSQLDAVLEVFIDNWIPNFAPSEILNRCIRYCPNLLVFTLISNSGEWNHEAISVFFPPNVANSILSIPLARSPKDDSWFWSLTPNGFYSVKSGYKEIRKEKIAQLQDSFFLQFSGVWKRIWKVQLPAKIKFFLWRLCREILPVCTNLVSRGVDVDPRCPVCSGGAEETIGHAILFCDQLQSLWNSIPVPFIGELDEEIRFVEWFNCALTQWNDSELCLFAIAAYKIWNRRNELRLVGNLHVRVDQSFAGTDPLPSWVPPSFSRLKVNVDACKRSEVASGLGCVVRNFQGRVVGALVRRSMPCALVELLEASAVLEGLRFARDLGCLDIDLEGDAQAVVVALNSQRGCISRLGTVLDSV